jgi:hypothetical protein
MVKERRVVGLGGSDVVYPRAWMGIFIEKCSATAVVVHSSVLLLQYPNQRSRWGGLALQTHGSTRPHVEH